MTNLTDTYMVHKGEINYGNGLTRNIDKPLPEQMFTNITNTIMCAIMMTSSNGNIFRVTGPLWGEFTQSSVNSPHKGQWRGALMISLIRTWRDGWVNNRDAGGLWRNGAHYGVIVKKFHALVSEALSLAYRTQLR